MMAEYVLRAEKKTTLMGKQCLDYFSWSVLQLLNTLIKSMNIRQGVSLLLPVNKLALCMGESFQD